jgi:ABC-2 type transport system permease protein
MIGPLGKNIGNIRPLLWRVFRDLRWPLFATGLLAFVFGFIWALIAKRMLGQIAPFFEALGGMGGVNSKDMEAVLFDGPGQLLRTLLGGERIDLNQAMDFLSICLVHPTMITILPLWAISRSTQAIAGEIDRGTMELLLAQPISRFGVWLGHMIAEATAMLILAILAVSGLTIGAWMISPLEVKPLGSKFLSKKPAIIAEMGPIRIRLEDPFRDKLGQANPPDSNSAEKISDRFSIRPAAFLLALPQLFGFMASISGLGIVISVLIRRRFIALGIGVLILLTMFLINLLGQLWGPLEPFRPLCVYYYYLPQEAPLGRIPMVDFREWFGPGIVRVPSFLVQMLVAAAGWGIALWILRKRDIPAPL